MRTLLIGFLLGLPLTLVINHILNGTLGVDYGRSFLVGFICGVTGYFAAEKIRKEA